MTLMVPSDGTRAPLPGLRGLGSAVFLVIVWSRPTAADAAGSPEKRGLGALRLPDTGRRSGQQPQKVGVGEQGETRAGGEHRAAAASHSAFLYLLNRL